MNSATFCFRNTKSGRTWGLNFVPSLATLIADFVGGSLMTTCLRHWLMPAFRSIDATALSVRLFPVPRMRDMICERTWRETVSVMRRITPA